MQEGLQIPNLPSMEEKKNPLGQPADAQNHNPKEDLEAKREERSVGLGASSGNAFCTWVFLGLDFEAHTQHGRREKQNGYAVGC